MEAAGNINKWRAAAVLSTIVAVAAIAASIYFATRQSADNTRAKNQTQDENARSPRTSSAQDTYRMMDGVIATKKKQITEYLAEIEKMARSAASDKIVLNSFDILNEYSLIAKKAAPPREAAAEIEKLDSSLKKHYLGNYAKYYDMLFIRADGEIFYTVRKQADYGKNIFEGEFGKTALARQLQNAPKVSFVDFEYYKASEEPSAFVISPVIKNGTLEGWIVFQCTANSVNNMFKLEKEIGITGEIFLVNRQRYMLTDSRFIGDTSILRKKLSRHNIEAKFREKKGHKVVVDYRGFRVLSSFDTFKTGTSEWLIIAKIDEDEVVTNFYKAGEKNLRTRLKDALTREPEGVCRNDVPGKTAVLVDMDEYRKEMSGGLLQTRGVSTCTALIVSLPGRFSYMAHISNIDEAYGGKTTDLLGDILKQTGSFDIYGSEKRYLQFTIVARHTDSILNIVDELVDHGILLSQIKFLYDGEAKDASLVTNDYSTGETYVTWTHEPERAAEANRCASTTRDIGSIAALLSQPD